MDLTIKVWRQKNRKEKGKMESPSLKFYEINKAHTNEFNMG